MYPEIMLIPMREELTRAGLKEARTAGEVDAALAEPGTTMLVVNSVCGCESTLGSCPDCLMRATTRMQTRCRRRTAQSLDQDCVQPSLASAQRLDAFRALEV